jgi:hypothetical protein
MNQWAFVTAAYAVVGLSTIGLTLWSWLSMRAAERDADAVKRRQ